jgi:hypothetical protein
VDGCQHLGCCRCLEAAGSARIWESSKDHIGCNAVRQLEALHPCDGPFPRCMPPLGVDN